MCFAELSFTWAQLAPQMGISMASGAGGHMHGLCKGLHGEHSMIWLQLVEHMAIAGGL